MKIFKVEKDKHGTVLGYSIFGITIMSREKFRIWDHIYTDTMLENISLENKNEKLERVIDEFDDLFEDYDYKIADNAYTTEQAAYRYKFGEIARTILVNTGHYKSRDYYILRRKRTLGY